MHTGGEFIDADGGAAIMTVGQPRQPSLKSRRIRSPDRRNITVAVRQEMVDPATCRMWSGQNRDYDRLNASNCRDLIESFEGHGRQEVPAIVRRIADVPGIQYEVICGARRHWAVSYLRRNGRPDLGLLVEPRDLTDADAFCLADLENRSRQDLSAYERAVDYARALETIYSNHQGSMAAALNLTDSSLSRYLEIARLPTEILDAFGTPHAIGVSHAATLAPLLRVAKDRERVLAATIALTAEQEQRLAKGKGPISAAQVMRTLLTRQASTPHTSMYEEYRDDQLRLVATATRSESGNVSVSVPGAIRRGREQVCTAVLALLNSLIPDEQDA